MRKLRRSYDDHVIAGVCGGIAETYNWDPTAVRFIAVLFLLSPVTSSMIFLAYIILAFIMPVKN